MWRSRLSKPWCSGWNLDAVAWRELQELVRTVRPHWHRCILNLTHSNSVPSSAGVYLIEFPAPFQPHTPEQELLVPTRAPIYIGRTETSLRDRFRSHAGSSPQDLIERARKWPIPNGQPQVFVFAELDRADWIIALESRLIDCFNPPCNKIKGATLGAGRPAGA
jgi:hypothetical protein